MKIRCIIIASGKLSTRLAAGIRRVMNESLVICADGGYDQAIHHGIRPDVVLGDFDSVKSRDFEEQGFEVITFPAEKDATDTMLAAEEGLNRGCRLFDIYGGIGGRMDHTIANIFTLNYIAGRGGIGRLYHENNEIFILSESYLEVSRRRGWKISLLPFTERCEGVYISGVKYPLENATLKRNSTLGVSNEFVEKTAKIRVKKGSVMIILSRD